jgi:hypothetical protein
MGGLGAREPARRISVRPAPGNGRAGDGGHVAAPVGATAADVSARLLVPAASVWCRRQSPTARGAHRSGECDQGEHNGSEVTS